MRSRLQVTLLQAAVYTSIMSHGAAADVAALLFAVSVLVRGR